jgi:2-isopropylmalate synthase
MENRVRFFDTTLRDGEQAPGCSMSLNEKLEIARALEKLGVDVIEAGFPVISPGDFESVRKIADTLKRTTVAGLARATVKDIDAAWEALKDAVSPRIHVFLATSPVHMEYKLKKTPDEVLQIIGEMVAYAKAKCPDVEFSCEDATRSEPEFLAKAVKIAIDAGATTINIPDTVGYTAPTEMAGLIRYLKGSVPGIENVTLSVHCHNDLGMAVANSLAAVAAGAVQVEGTINGIGERAGNAALEEVAMAIVTRPDQYPAGVKIDTTQIYATSRLVYNILGLVAPINKAIVGGNAFAHEAGIHQHGVMANRATYEIMTPQSVGLVQNKMVLGKHSGRHAVEGRLSELGYTLSTEELSDLFDRFKVLADKKSNINDMDLVALVSHKIAQSQGVFQLDRFTVNSGNYVSSSAVVRLRHGDELIEEVCLGDGPIDAAFNAVDKIMNITQPHFLDDYAIHTVSEGKDAQGEAMVRIQCDGRSVVGRGLSTDVIEASILAYVAGMNKLVG